MKRMKIKKENDNKSKHEFYFLSAMHDDIVFQIPELKMITTSYFAAMNAEGK